jgi:DNA polymerase III delta prime subunit
MAYKDPHTDRQERFIRILIFEKFGINDEGLQDIIILGLLYQNSQADKIHTYDRGDASSIINRLQSWNNLRSGFDAESDEFSFDENEFRYDDDVPF